MRLKTLLSTEAGKLVPGARPQIAGTPPRAGEQRKWQNWGGNAIFGQRWNQIENPHFPGFWAEGPDYHRLLCPLQSCQVVFLIDRKKPFCIDPNSNQARPNRSSCSAGGLPGQPLDGQDARQGRLLREVGDNCVKVFWWCKEFLVVVGVAWLWGWWPGSTWH